MRSIYQIALGNEFQNLHPNIQQRLSLSSKRNIAVIGKGTMEEVWRGKWFTVPFLNIGKWRNIMFPETGTSVPFTIENYAYCDEYGRETITWVRSFQFPKTVRRFDATMIYSHSRNRIIDFLGTHQHLAVDIEISADTATKGFRIRSGNQRFYIKKLGLNFPLLFSGYADVCEWYDDAEKYFKIDVAVKNKLLGKLFGYRGSFKIEYVDCNHIPTHVIPIYTQQSD